MFWGDGTGYADWDQRPFDKKVSPLEVRRARNGPVTKTELKLVLEIIETMFFVIGITEHLAQSLALIALAVAGKAIELTQILERHCRVSNSQIKAALDCLDAPDYK